MLERVVVVLVAACAIVWLAAGYRSVQLEDSARALAGPSKAAGDEQIREVRDRLRRARRLQPDVPLLVAEGGLLVTAGRPRAALPLLEEAARREPRNALAWGLLAQAAAKERPARARQAAARLRELRPPVPPR